MSIVLIGYRGSGKSTIGHLLANRLGLSFVDLDELIVKKAGKSIRDIFAEDGEPVFRQLETRQVLEVFNLPDHVISLGGGSLHREENRQALRDTNHKVIYLKCDPPVLHRRIQSDPNTTATRPNLTSLGGGIDEIRTLLAEREPIYRQIMHAEVDVTSLTPDEAVQSIAQYIKESGFSGISSFSIGE